MPILEEPDSINPTRLRVNKGINGKKHSKNFSFDDHGVDGAWKKARECNAKFEKMAGYNEMRLNLDHNVLFEPNGRVIGITQNTRKRKGREVFELLIIRSGRTIREVSLNCRTFSEGYEMARDILLELRGIELDAELKILFEKAKPYVLDPTRLNSGY